MPSERTTDLVTVVVLLLAGVAGSSSLLRAFWGKKGGIPTLDEISKKAEDARSLSRAYSPRILSKQPCTGEDQESTHRDCIQSVCFGVSTPGLSYQMATPRTVLP